MSSPESGKGIEELRVEMDAANADFVIAFVRRCLVGDQIGQVKRVSGAPQVRDYEREDAVREHSVEIAEEISEGKVPADAVRRVVQLAMDISSELQMAQTGLPMDQLFQITAHQPERPILRRTGW